MEIYAARRLTKMSGKGAVKEIFVILNNFSKTVKNGKMKNIFIKNRKYENYFHFTTVWQRSEKMLFIDKNDKISKKIQNTVDKTGCIC